MAELEKFMNREEGGIDPLIRAALIHYQFETIHQFLDGNGRVGRLLITLFLLEQKVLQRPALYISYYLKKNRIEYYDRMTEVRHKDNYEQWVKFFLEAVYAAADDAIATVYELSALCKNDYQKIVYEKRMATKLEVFDYIQRHPIMEIGRTASDLGVTYNTAAKAVQSFIEKGILTESGKSGRSRTFVYRKYLDILAWDTELY